MSLKSIVIEPDTILRKKSEPVEQVDDSTRKLLDDMIQTMYAPQVLVWPSTDRYSQTNYSNRHF